MSKQITSKRYKLIIPVSIEIRLLKDKSLVAQSETEIAQIVDEKFLQLLERNRELGKELRIGVLSEEFKHEVDAFIHGELLPKNLAGSPAHQPDIIAEVTIKGNVTTWKREPEEMKN